MMMMMMMTMMMMMFGDNVGGYGDHVGIDHYDQDCGDDGDDDDDDDGHDVQACAVEVQMHISQESFGFVWKSKGKMVEETSAASVLCDMHMDIAQELFCGNLHGKCRRPRIPRLNAGP